ncbi:pilus assembly protein [Marinovum sp.]|uniref:TadE/TadG family type IV pilus assembly protein n=1 Tax=Marinovum sp. TaxID=2024839 RepID=UPI002B26B6FA|nr:pilus assembly protein [Marinovum sp.]
MTHRLTLHLRRFAREEAGSVETVAFALWMPMIVILLLTMLEVGAYTARSVMLERAVDQTVRTIRLETGAAPQHDAIKEMICERAVILPNCNANLRLEMVQRDPRSWLDLPGAPDCTDNALEVAPVRQFTNGLTNQLMVLRACAKITPIFPTTFLAGAIDRDTAGDYALVASTSFVQEPR